MLLGASYLCPLTPSTSVAWADPGGPNPVVAAPVVQAPIVPSLVSTVAVFRRDDGKGGPGEAVAQFTPADRAQHFEVGAQGLKEGSAVRWEFTALETAVGSRPLLASIDRSAAGLQGATEVILNGKIELPRDWPIGRYRATVLVNGVVLRMLDYVVAPPPTPAPRPPDVTAIKMARDDGRGKPGLDVERFAPGDRRMHFRAELSSAYTGKARWKFTAVATASGNNIQLLELNGDVSSVNTLSAQMNAPRDWPIGQYRAELFLNEILSKTFEFVISGN